MALQVVPGFTQVQAQKPTRPGESGPDRTDRYVERPSHFLVAQSGPGHQEQNVEGGSIELTQRPGDRGRLAPEEQSRQHILRWIAGRSNSPGRPFPPDTAILTAPVVTDQIGGDAEKPGPGIRTSEIKSVPRTEGGGKGLPDEVLGDIPSHPLRHVTMHGSGMAVKENGECTGVDQRGAHPFGVGRLDPLVITHHLSLAHDAEIGSR